MPSLTTLVDGTVPVAADFNGNYLALNRVCGLSTAITTYATGDTVYASATDTLSKLAIAGNGQVIGAVSGVPAWYGHLQTTASRLTFSSTTAIQLGVGVIPLKVGSNWTLRSIAAAITVSNATLGASTLYYVYAYDNAGVTTLDTPSATGHTTDTTWGVETKTGDATRTLVGMIRTNGSSQFEDDNSLRGVLSYYARRNIGLVNGFTTDRTVTPGTTYTEFNTEIRANFLTWADEAVSIAFTGAAQGTVAGFGAMGLAVDSATTVSDAQCGNIFTTNVIPVSLALHANALSEGFHFATVLGANDTGAAGITTKGAAAATTSPTKRSTLSVKTRG